YQLRYPRQQGAQELYVHSHALGSGRKRKGIAGKNPAQSGSQGTFGPNCQKAIPSQAYRGQTVAVDKENNCGGISCRYKTGERVLYCLHCDEAPREMFKNRYIYMKKVVLAVSGGLDTSFCCIYLSKDLGMEVHSVVVNTGGFSEEETKQIEARAYELGVKSHTTIDETENYYRETIKYLIFGNVLKNATYPLSVSAERVCQATAIA